jgi:hypothetical protein
MKQQDMLPDTANRVWITSVDERSCDFCNSMNGEVATIDGGWDTSKGYVEYPQASHPHCRCSAGITMSKPTKSSSVSKVEEIEWDTWLLLKGESAGHAFRGNQWTRNGLGSGLTASTGKIALSKSLRAIENGDPNAKRAVTLYCSEQNRYKRINRELRENKGKKVSSETKQLDSAFEQFGVTLDKPVTVYRGAVLPKKILEKIQNTGTFVEHGYCSTTLRQSLAQEFSQSITPSNMTGKAPRGKVNVVFEVVLPKGTVVLGGNNRGGREEELILPRGTKFRYVETNIGHKLEVVSK